MAIFRINLPCVPNEGWVVTMCKVSYGTVIYSLKSSVEAGQAIIGQTLRDIGYESSLDDSVTRGFHKGNTNLSLVEL